jgi:hypothetical protein
MTYYLGGKHDRSSYGDGRGGWSNDFGNGVTHNSRDDGDGGFIGELEYGDGEGGDLKGNGVSFTHNDSALIFEHHDTLQHSVMLVALMPLIRRRLK